jgi:hypothetical protein
MATCLLNRRCEGVYRVGANNLRASKMRKKQLKHMGPDWHPEQVRKFSIKRVLEQTFPCGQPMTMTNLVLEHSDGYGTHMEEIYAH